MSIIAAIATPPGSSALAIIRISGNGCREVLMPLINLSCEKDFQHGVIRRAEFDAGNIKDDITAIFYSSPKSFTGEDMIEIFCHGSNFISGEIMRALIKGGCRQAQNGEFTRRAFLNGKLDLTRAEGIIDLINSDSEAGCNAAYNTVKGGLFDKIRIAQNSIKEIIAEMSAVVDYPEEDLTELTFSQQSEKIESALRQISLLVEGYYIGSAVREGIKVAIAGEPNVGKSMLFNALLDRNRAIVTSIAGTTRDTIEEAYVYEGLKFVLTDTAGIRESSDTVEKIGIKRAVEATESADVVLIVSEKGKNFDYKSIKGQKIIKVLNKADLLDDCAKLSGFDIHVSALSGEGIDNLRKMIYSVSKGETYKSGEVRLNNARQLNAAVEAQNALSRALKAIIDLTPADCVISDLNESYRALGQITGLITSDGIVDEIFKRFCVGK